MFNFLRKKERGFTMIESLVAISILLIALTGPLVLVRQGISSARLAKDQITAFYLGQDAIEYIRAIRDSNIIQSVDWLTGLESCIGEGNLCEVDVIADEVSACGVDCDYLRRSSEGMYGYDSGWDLTTFKREINLFMNSDDEAIIKVTLHWNGGKNDFMIRDYIFNLR